MPPQKQTDQPSSPPLSLTLPNTDVQAGIPIFERIDQLAWGSSGSEP